MGGEVDYRDCEAEDLAEAIDQVHGLALAAHRELVGLVRAFEASEAWADDGARSMVDWLVARRGVSHQSAASWVDLGRSLESLPGLAQALAEGRTSLDQVRPAVRLAEAEAGVEDEVGDDLEDGTGEEAEDRRGERLAEADNHWAGEAPSYSAAMLAHLARRARPATLKDAEAAHRDRRLRWWWEGQVLRLSGRLGPDQGAVVGAAIERVVARTGPDPVTGAYDALVRRSADALVEVCSAALGADPDPDRACVVVHAELEALLGDEGLAEVQGGPLVCAETLRRWLCDGRVQLSLDDHAGRPVGLGRTTRTVPPWMVRVLRRRDQTCRFPGCGCALFLDAHHLRPWSQGGPTELSNLALTCRRHHRLVHEGGWRIEGDPDGELVFLGPTGQVLPRPPSPLRAELAERFFGPGLGASSAGPSGPPGWEPPGWEAPGSLGLAGP